MLFSLVARWGAHCCLKMFNFSRVLGELLGAHLPRGPLLEPLGLLELIEIFWRNLRSHPVNVENLPLGPPEPLGTPENSETSETLENVQMAVNAESRYPWGALGNAAPQVGRARLSHGPPPRLNCFHARINKTKNNIYIYIYRVRWHIHRAYKYPPTNN